MPRPLARLLGRRLAKQTGTIHTAVQGEVTIHRDGYGVPSILATNDADAWFGLGFCQGQDRATQIQLLARIAEGRLAEWVGAKGLGPDRIVRRLGLKAVAEQQWKHIDEASRQTITNFARGVNAATATSPRSHELFLLGVKPEPLAPEAIVRALLLVSFLQPSNWDKELSRLKLALELEGPVFSAIEPAPAEWLALGTPLQSALTTELAALTEWLPSLRGSNNWALRRAKTQSGGPILANDPHMPPTLPNAWYLCHVETPDWRITGACFAGTPGILIGHNGHAAWSVTHGFVDNSDWFIEKIGADGRSVLRGDRYVPCTVREEVIKVRRQKPVVETVLETSHGPLVSPALGGGLPPLALSATWLRADALPGLPKLHRLRSFAELRENFRGWAMMPFNLVYADAGDNVGWQLVGLPPRRRAGGGLMPLPGSDPRFGWEPTLEPFERLPYLSNPPEDFVASANNKPHVPLDVHVSCDWIDDFRIRRIREVLAAKNDWTVDSTMQFQQDRLSVTWRDVRENILTALEPPSKAHALMASWDGVMDAKSPPAQLWAAFLMGIIRRTLATKVGGDIEWAMGRGFASDLAPITYYSLRLTWMLRLFQTQPPGWFPQSSWPEEIRRTFDETVAMLERRFGTADRWDLGAARPVRFKHFFGDVPVLRHAFSPPPAPVGGYSFCVNQVAIDPRDGFGAPLAIANVRAVMDLSNCGASRFVLAGGQSGNPCSPHYDDQIPLWAEGRAIPVASNRAEAERSSVKRLVLAPATSAVPPL